MAKLMPVIGCQSRLPSKLFGATLFPGFTMADLMTPNFFLTCEKTDETGAFGGGRPDLYVEEHTNSLILKPNYFPVDMTTEGWSFGTASKWEAVPHQPYAPAGKKVLTFKDASGGTTDYAESTTNIISPLYNNQAHFVVYLQRAAIPLGQDPYINTPEIQIKWGHNSGNLSDTDEFTLRLTYGISPTLTRQHWTNNVADPPEVHYIPLTGTASEALSNVIAEGASVRVLTLARGLEKPFHASSFLDYTNEKGIARARAFDMLVQLFMGGVEVFWVIMPDVTVRPSKIKVTTKNGSFSFTYYPIKFGNKVIAGAPSGGIRSPTRYLGVAPLTQQMGGQDRPDFIIDGHAPKGHRITVSFDGYSPTKTEYKYQAHLTGLNDGNGFSDDTPVLRMVMTKYNPVIAFFPAQDEIISLKVRSLTLSRQFDTNRLYWTTQGYIELDNFAGTPLLHPTQKVVGYRALELSLLWYVETPTGWKLVPGQGDGMLLTGLHGFEQEWTEEEGRGTLRSHFHCRTLQLMDSIIETMLPYFDGMCHYKAIRWLLDYAGIDAARWTRDDEQGRRLREDEDLADDPHYKLPIGDGLFPLTNFPPGMSLFECIAQIAQRTSFVWGFDAHGRFVYEPHNFRRTASIGGLPGTGARRETKKKFRIVPSVTDDGLPGLDEIFRVSYSASLRDARNVTRLIGLDPHRNVPLVAVINRVKRTETGDVFIDPNALLPDGIDDPNSPIHVPYRKSFIDINSMYSTRRLIDQTAAQIHDYISLPVRTTTFETFAQPNLDVLDVIEVEMPKSPGHKKQFIVLSHSVTADAYSRVARSTIVARELM